MTAPKILSRDPTRPITDGHSCADVSTHIETKEREEKEPTIRILS